MVVADDRAVPAGPARAAGARRTPAAPPRAALAPARRGDGLPHGAAGGGLVRNRLAVGYARLDDAPGRHRRDRSDPRPRAGHLGRGSRPEPLGARDLGAP